MINQFQWICLDFFIYLIYFTYCMSKKFIPILCGNLLYKWANTSWVDSMILLFLLFNILSSYYMFICFKILKTQRLFNHFNWLEIMYRKLKQHKWIFLEKKE